MYNETDVLVVAVVLAINSLISATVYLTDKKSETNRVFAIFTFFVALWTASAFVADIFRNETLNLIFSRFAYSNVVAGISLLVYFSFKFPKCDRVPVIYKLFSLVLGPLLYLVCLSSDSIISGIKYEKWGFSLLSGKLYLIFISYLIIGIGIALVKFFISWRKAIGAEKEKLKYLFIGLILFIFFAFFFNVIIRDIIGSDIYYKYGNYSIIFFTSFAAYAILKFALFDIRVILTQTAGILLSISVLVQLVISKTTSGAVINFIILVLVSYGSYLLNKSVKKEIKQKEELETASHDLKDAYKKLEELDKMKTEFISVASHELLTPISAIEGYLSMMLEEKLVKIEDPKAVQYMDSVYKSSKRLARLVTDLLNVTRIEEGRLLVQKIEIDAKDIINQVISELKFKAQDAKLSVSTYFQEGADTMVYADPDKIKEVLINIAGNSIKYTPEGGHFELGCFIYPAHEIAKKFEDMQEDIIKCNSGPVDESLQKAVDKRLKQFVGDDQLVIFSKDTGVGLKPDDLCRLFKKFSRVGEWSTRQVQGTGLGLYISKALVEMHHGRIWAESAGENTGSQFFFSLPLARNRKEIENIDKKIPQAADAKPLAKNKEIN